MLCFAKSSVFQNHDNFELLKIVNFFYQIFNISLSVTNHDPKINNTQPVTKPARPQPHKLDRVTIQPHGANQPNQPGLMPGPPRRRPGGSGGNLSDLPPEYPRSLRRRRLRRFFNFLPPEYPRRLLSEGSLPPDLPPHSGGF